MKTPLYVSLALAGLVIATSRVIADPSPGGDDELRTDPDGVPVSVTHPQAKQPTQADIEAYHRQQQQAALDKNWLLRGYEQQREARAAADIAAGQPNSDFYYQLSLNKDLARLAGVPSFDSAGSSKNADDGTDQTASKTRTSAEKTSSSSPTSPLQTNLFKPLVSPLGQPVDLSLHNYYADLLSHSGSGPVPHAAPRQESRDLDLDTPGMIASKKDPLLDISTPSDDPSLEVLPGESIQDAREHQDDYNKLQLPMTADQLHQTQTSALNAPTPGAPKTGQPTKAIPVAKAVPQPDVDAPIPVNQAPVISPVRTPIANPYDILNR